MELAGLVHRKKISVEHEVPLEESEDVSFQSPQVI
jgi:hypothetical protein